MLKQTCDMLLAQAELKRQEAIAAAEEEYQKAVEAVRVLLEMSGAAKRLAHGTLSGAVLEAVEQLDGAFTVRDVEERIRELAPEVAERASIASISTTLRRLAEKQRIYLAEPGTGVRPALYHRLEGTMSLEGGSCREPIADRGENQRPTPC